MDPRSTLLQPPPNVLETPSLIDESKCSVTWGEAVVERHEDSPKSVHRDRTELVSESQIVTGGGVVLDLFFSDSFPDSPVVSRVSSPSLDDEKGYQTIIPPNLPGPTDFVEDRPLSNLLPSRNPDDAPSMQGPGPISVLDGNFMCPKCPRTFKGFIKARYSSVRAP